MTPQGEQSSVLDALTQEAAPAQGAAAPEAKKGSVWDALEQQAAYPEPTLGQKFNTVVGSMQRSLAGAVGGTLQSLALGSKLFDRAVDSMFGTRNEHQLKDYPLAQAADVVRKLPDVAGVMGTEPQNIDPRLEGSMLYNRIPAGVAGAGALAAAGPMGVEAGIGAKAGMAVAGAAQSAGPAYAEAKAADADEATAMKYAAAHAAISAGMALPLQGAVLRLMGRAAPAEQALMVRLAKDAATFGAYSGGAKTLENLLDKHLMGKDRALLDGVASEVAVGSAVGAILGAVPHGAEILERAQRKRQGTSTLEDALHEEAAPQPMPQPTPEQEAGPAPFLEEPPPDTTEGPQTFPVAPPSSEDASPPPPSPPGEAAPGEPPTTGEPPAPEVQPPSTATPPAVAPGAGAPTEPPGPPGVLRGTVGPILPRELAGAKPRYGYSDRNFTLTFSSDVDRALFVTAQGKKSARDADYRSWLRDQGMTDAEIDQVGPKVRAAIKAQAASHPRGAPTDLVIPPIHQISPQASGETPVAPVAPPPNVHALGDTLLHIPGREKPLPASLLMVDTEDIRPSHDVRNGFKRNPGADPNERPYEDPNAGKDLRARVRKHAEEVNPAFFLSDTPTAIDGPPIVRDSGEVLGGNGRVMTAQLIYDEGGAKAARFRDAMLEYAKRLGVDASNMERPIVVRVLRNDVAGKPGELSAALNETYTAPKTVTARAVSRGARVDTGAADTISKIIGPEGALRDALQDKGSTTDILRALRESGAITDKDVNEWVRPDGLLSQGGREEIEQTLLGSVVGDVRTIEEMSPLHREVLVKGMGSLSRLKTAWPEFTDHLKLALDGLSDLKRSGQSLKDALGQQTIEEQPWKEDPLAVSILNTLRQKRSSEVLARLSALATAVENAESGQGGLFEQPDADPESALTRVLGEYGEPPDEAARPAEEAGSPRPQARAGERSLLGAARAAPRSADGPAAIGEIGAAADVPLGGGATSNPPDPIIGGSISVSIPGRIARRILAGLSRPGKLTSWRNVQDAMVDVVRTAGIDPAVRTGRMKLKWAAGTFNTQSHVIRLMEADDVRTLCHECGHALDKAVFGFGKTGPYSSPAKSTNIKAELMKLGRLAYPPGSPQPTAGYKVEGWAHFVELFVTQPKAAERLAPDLHDWFQNEYLTKQRRDIGEKFDQARDLWHKWNNVQTPLEREQATRIDRSSLMSKTERVRAGMNRFFSMQNHIDMAAPIHEFASFVEEQLLKRGAKLPPGQNPSKLLTLFRGQHSARAERFAREHTTDLAGNVTGESLEQAFAPAKGQEDLLTAYLRAKRSLVVWDSKGANPGMARPDAQSIVDLVQGKHPEVAHAASRVWSWWERVNDFAAQASPNYRALIDRTRASDPGFYVPLHRAFDAFDQAWVRSGKPRASTGGALVKALKGAGLEVVNPLHELMAESNRRIAMAHREVVMDSLFKLSKTEGAGPVITEVPRNMEPVYSASVEALVERAREKWKGYGGDIDILPGASGVNPADVLVSLFMPESQTPEGKPIVSRYDATTAKVKWYEVDPELYHALGSMDEYRLPQLLETPLGKMRDLFTTGTIARVSYGLIRNPLRDLQTIWLNTRTSAHPAKLATDWLRTQVKFATAHATHGKVTLGQMEGVRAFLDLGLENSMTMGQDVDRIARSSSKMLGDRKIHPITGARSLIQAYREILSIPEAGSRIVEFENVGREIGWKPGSQMSLDQAVQMGIAAKQVSVDFTAAGEFSRAANRLVPFYNAAFQGPRATIQAMKRNPGLFFLKGLSSFTLPTLALWYMHKDEDWWKEMNAKERFAFWHVPVDVAGGKHLLRVPRAHFEMSLFASMPEALLDAAYQKNPEIMSAWAGNFIQYTAPSGIDIPVSQNFSIPIPAPVPLIELAEQMMNYDMFSGTPVVPRGDEEKPVAEQFNEHTTSAAITIGRVLNMSPRRIDHAVRGLFGGLPTDVAGLAGVGAEETNLEREPADFPGIGTLFQRGGITGIRSASIDKMYDLLEVMTRQSQSDLSKETYHQRELRLQTQDAAHAVSALSWVRAHTPKLADRQALEQKSIEIAHQAVDRVLSDSLGSRGQFHVLAAQYGIKKKLDEQRLRASSLGAIR